MHDESSPSEGRTMNSVRCSASHVARSYCAVAMTGVNAPLSCLITEHQKPHSVDVCDQVNLHRRITVETDEGQQRDQVPTLSKLISIRQLRTTARAVDTGASVSLTPNKDVWSMYVVVHANANTDGRWCDRECLYIGDMPLRPSGR